MLSFVIDLEKTAFASQAKAEHVRKAAKNDLEAKLAKLQTDCNLFEAALNAGSRGGKSLFEQFVSSVCFVGFTLKTL